MLVAVEHDLLGASCDGGAMQGEAKVGVRHEGFDEDPSLGEPLDIMMTVTDAGGTKVVLP